MYKVSSIKYKKRYRKHFSVFLLFYIALFPVPYSLFPGNAFAQANDPAPLQIIDITKKTEVDEEKEFEDLKNSLLINASINSLTETQQNKVITTEGIRTHVQLLKKRTYKSTEKIPVVVENEDPSKVEIEVFDSDGVKVDVEITDVSIANAAILRVSPPSHFKPGKFHMKITDSEGNVTTQDFTWGVLAINTNKSIYLPNETASLFIGVLDETGNMVCDADVVLTITDPSGKATEHSTKASSIKVNPQCYSKQFSLEPDYEARYTTNSSGKYNILLSATTENGTYTINDSFEVMDNVPFDVERESATRIFPPLEYPMLFKIKADKDFVGEVKEIVPENFIVSNIEGLPPFETVATHSSILETKNDTVALSKPFNGFFYQTQGFGVDETDSHMAAKYAKYGLIGHDGLDFALPTGTPVLAVDDGYIVKSDVNGDYGTTVIIQHSWGRSYYGHLSKIEKEFGTRVTRGETIGISGNTGLLTTGPHLHFGIKFNDNNPANGYYGKVNPLPYLNSALDQAVAGVATPSATLVNEDSQGVQVLTWKVDVKAGETLNLGYKYLAPKKSPQFYTVGPLSFNAEGEDGFPEFVEARKWQIAVDADGSGTNTVTPTTGTTSATGQTYTFTFTAAETMDSGGFKITVPSGWTAPQGTNGVAGYTTAVGNGNATVGRVLNTADSATGWAEDDGDMCDTFGLDTTNFKEGTGSLFCAPTAADNTDSISVDISEDWSSYNEVSFWTWSDQTTTNGGLSFFYDDTANGSSPLERISIPAMSAGVWTYVKGALTATRTSVATYGIECTTAGNNHDFGLGGTGVGRINIDYIMLGPGVPTFSGNDITVNLLDAANTETVTVTYGAGGGSSGVTNSSTEGAHTFTTQSRIDAGGTLTNISSSPTVTLSASSNPANDQFLRHGAWFNNGIEQPFFF